MSAGDFEYSKYESDAGNIYRVRVQPETLAATIGSANAAPAGATDTEGTIKINFSRRAFGITQRFVTVRFTATVPTGYSADSTPRIPIMTKSVYDAIDLDDTGTYLGSAVEVIAKSAESIK